MTQMKFPVMEDLPESLCNSAQAGQDHVPHVVYAGTSNIRIGRCPGVGTFETVVTPPADPFCGCE